MFQLNGFLFIKTVAPPPPVANVLSVSLIAASFPDTLIALGSDGTYQTSTSGSGWITGLSFGVSLGGNTLTGMAGTGNKVVACGTGGTVLLSTNAGSTWAAQTSNTIHDLIGIFDCR